MLISVLVVTALVSVILVGQVLVSIRTIENAQLSIEKDQIQSFTLGCLEEGLISLQRDNSYTGQNFNLGAGNCTITVSGAGGSRTMVVVGTIGDNSADINASITFSPFSLESYSF